MERLLSIADQFTRRSKILDYLIKLVEDRVTSSITASACTGDGICGCGTSACENGYRYYVCSEFWWFPEPGPAPACYPQCAVQIPC